MIDPKEARRLLDACANAELMSLVTPEEMGRAWCRYASRNWKIEGTIDWQADEDGWAAELYHEREFKENEVFVRAFLVTVVANAPDEVMEWVGAGLLEDFLGEADEDGLLWLEGQTEQSERFRQALRSVGTWRSAGFEYDPKRGTLTQKSLEPDPVAEAIIRRIQRLL